MVALFLYQSLRSLAFMATTTQNNIDGLEMKKRKYVGASFLNS